MSTLADLHHNLSFQLIDAYRDLIDFRYSQQFIKPEVYNISASDPLTAKFLEKFREYFLTYVFPPSQDRAKLENAFEKLNKYITSPAKIWYLLGDLTGAIFKFGRLFPKALKAGFISMRTFERAKQFEEQILKSALENDFSSNIDREKILKCLKSIERADAENFIRDINVFLKSMTHSELLFKTMTILKSVVATMKNHPATYPDDEIEGVMSGMLILEKAYELFSNITEQQRILAVDLIIQIELDFLDYIYGR